MNNNQKLEANITQTLGIEHSKKNIKRQSYISPQMTRFESEDITGGQISHVLEITSGLLTS